MSKLNAEQLVQLRGTYNYILTHPAVLVQVAATKGGTVRAIFQSLVDDVAEVNKEIARLSASQEGVKA